MQLPNNILLYHYLIRVIKWENIGLTPCCICLLIWSTCTWLGVLIEKTMAITPAMLDNKDNLNYDKLIFLLWLYLIGEQRIFFICLYRNLLCQCTHLGEICIICNFTKQSHTLIAQCNPMSSPLRLLPYICPYVMNPHFNLPEDFSLICTFYHTSLCSNPIIPPMERFSPYILISNHVHFCLYNSI